MKDKLTIRDIALRAGVSKTTVSYVLNRREDVAISQETRTRIFEAAKELGYRHNLLARGFARGKSQSIGVVVCYRYHMSGYLNEFVARILQGAEEVCKEHNYQIFPGWSADEEGNEDAQINSLLSHRIRALLLINYRGTQMQRYIEAVSSEGIQCVIVDDKNFADSIDSVVTDDLQGAMQAVEHLLCLGHKRIAYFGPDPAIESGITTAQDRRTGYSEALRKAGVAIEESLLVEGSINPEQALTAATQMLNSSRIPPAVFAYNDYLAAAVIQAAAQRGIRIPDDLALVGYSDLGFARWLNLTTIHQDAREMGRRAGMLVFEKLNAPTASPDTVILPTHLIIRRSCGAQDYSSDLTVIEQGGDAVTKTK